MKPDDPLPMFPLNAVVFPFTAVPLRVFEPRYQALVDAVVAGTPDRFGMVLIERGSEVGGGDSRFDVGALVEILQVQDLADGHRAVLVAGVQRIRVTAWLEDDPHPWAKVVALDLGDPPPSTALDRMSALIDRVLSLASELGADVLARTDLAVSEDPLAAAYQLVALSPLTTLDQQRLLEMDDVTAMVERASELLVEEAELLAARLGAD